jgi:hypothetical protein
VLKVPIDFHGRWIMNTGEILLNFREALLGVVPCFEKVGVPWRRPDSYDQWDDTAASLFNALVEEPLRAMMPEAERIPFKLPKYDTLLPSYSGVHVIEVLSSGSDSSVKVFHSFGTSVDPFDVMEVRAVGRGGTPESNELEIVPVSRAGVRLIKLGKPTR